MRYLLGVGDTIIARQPLTVTGVAATLTAPAQVAAGAKFKGRLDGPEQSTRLRDPGEGRHAEKTYERYEYTSRGSPWN